MNLYIAGLYASHFHLGGNLYRKLSANSKAHRDAVQHRLESYHYVKKGQYVKHMREDGVKVFLDSGAFSSFSLGVEVSIDEYAEFIKGHQDIILMASVLDAIGDPVGTYHNQNTLEKLGAEVLPCFHFGEPLDLCEYYVKNYPYMTIGGMVPIPNNKLEVWLDEIWDRVLTDKDGYARNKVHGFGLTARKLMAKYPWFSVDSSSWVQVAANGGLVIPELAQPVATSARSPKAKDFMGHYNTLPELTQKHVDSLLHHYGLTIEDVRDDHKPRWAMNAYSYHMTGVMLGDDHWRKPFKSKQTGLF